MTRPQPTHEVRRAVLNHDVAVGWPPPPEGRHVDLRRGAAIVTYREVPSTRVTPDAHREVVVQRLLGRGLSVRLLLILLPDWRRLIERVAVRR